ncbi:MAG: ABC transporter ATP-binding protein [Anaerolineae bacterium]
MRLIQSTVKRAAKPSRHDVSLLERRYRGEAPLKTYLYLYKGDWNNLALAVVFFIIKHSGVWAMPVVTARIVDIIADPTGHSLNSIWLYLGLMVLIYGQNLPMHYLFALRLSVAVRNMETKLRAVMSRRLQYLSMNFYHRSSTGALHTKLLRDVEVLQDMTMQLSQTAPAAVFTLIFALVVTAIRVPAFLIFFALTVPLAAWLTKTMQRGLQQQNRDFRKKVEAMSSGFNDMIHLIPITRAHGIEEVELDRVEKRLWHVRQAGMELDATTAFFGASAWVAFRMFEVACLGTAAFAAYTQIIPVTVGDVIMLTGFFTNLTNSVLMITTLLPQITRGFESIYSIGEVLESPDLEENEGKPAVEQVNGRFDFESVSFAYPDTTDSSLDQLTFTVQPGETVAFVGPSGAGKSTLLNLIIGFIRPTSGRILLDGQDMNALDLRTYRHFLSVVPQETVLFDGTLRENVLYGVKDVDEATLQQVLEAANITDFLDDLPEGLDTYLGENAVRLSGGQKQRLAIARALIRDPRVLVLDEATSALDPVSEARIQQALYRLTAGRTTFVVAHRLSTIQRADKIIVLDAGRIVEVGTHAALLEKDGVYASMYRVMFAAQP